MKTKIVIASTLKPVDDVRAYWKFAQSIVETNKQKYEINILGNFGKKASDFGDIHFYPHKLRRSQFLKRLFIPFSIFIKAWHLEPHILIITTHELLFSAVLIKSLLGCKIIYDVQENYSQNATLNEGIKGKVVALLIRAKEWMLSRYISHFILAEDCYKSQLQFIKNNYSVIENKAVPHNLKQKSPGLKMLFSGTLSYYAGTDLALKIMLKILEVIPDSEGLIIGQIHDKNLSKELRKKASRSKRITLHMSSTPVSYTEILQAIDWATLGIISYQTNEINRDKIPTKLYEYSRYKLPYLVQKKSKWESIGKSLGGAIAIDFSTENTDKLVKKLKHLSDSLQDPYPYEATWEFESHKLVELIKSLTDNS